MDKSNYGEYILSEICECFNHFKGDSDVRMKAEHHKAFDKVLERAGELISAIKDMRDLYKESGFLPLYHVNSEYEDLMTMLGSIEEEIMMFGKPMNVQKIYEPISDEELEEIKNSSVDLLITGLDKWVDEGLI